MIQTCVWNDDEVCKEHEWGVGVEGKGRESTCGAANIPASFPWETAKTHELHIDLDSLT